MKTTFKMQLLSAAIVLGLSGCTSVLSSENQKVVDTLASQLDVNFEVLDNHGAQNGMSCKAMGAEWASCNKVVMTLLNDGQAVPNTDWKLYLHSVRVILDIDTDEFTVKHITGDLYEIAPTSAFKGFTAGESLKIPMVFEYWELFETDFMPRAYIVSGDAKPKTIKSMDTEILSDYVSPITGNNWKRTPEDNNVLATAASRYEKNSDVSLLSARATQATIIPTPMKMKQMRGELNISKGFNINNNKALDKNQLNVFKQRAKSLGVKTNGSVNLNLDVNPNGFSGDMAVSGAYKLSVNAGNVSIIGYDAVGAQYGLQSLLALVDVNNLKAIHMVAIEDAPRFDYRGVMVDVARNFHSKEAIERTIDQMAAYKMNKLHLHLTDDEGWRLEIPGLPELTEIGGNRCHDLNETKCLLPQLGSGPNSDNFGSGYFSKKEYIDILKYAKARGIEVIPEIDMPAHSRAAVMSMEARFKKYASDDINKAMEYRLTDPDDTSNVTTVQFYDKHSFINPCMDSSVRFVNKVIAEVKAMHAEAGMPLNTWHFGGDEAKNIKLNAGFQDINADPQNAWQGSIDLAKQQKPFEKSPLCQKLIDNGTVADAGHLPSYFAERVSKIVNDHGIQNFQAWQDGLKYSKDASAFKTENVRVNFWDVLYWGGDASAYDWASKGYDMIVSNPDYVYMDMPYEVDPKERGYYWATRATDTRKMFGFAPENLPQNAETSVDRDGNGFKGKGTIESKGIHGLSAQLWSESVRTDDQYEYMVFPRVLAAAERAWHAADWELDYEVGKEFNQETNHVNKSVLLKDWTRFSNALGHKELAKMDKAGIQYRIPVPGAMVNAGKLYMNISLPGLPMQYSLDNGATWNAYTAPVDVVDVKTVKVRALSADKLRQGRAVSL